MISCGTTIFVISQILHHQVSQVKMADGSTKHSKSMESTGTNKGSENEARAIRVLEIMNDFRTLQVHITSLVNRPSATPARSADQYLEGYIVLRQCNAEAQAILATRYNPGNLGIGNPGAVPETEMQKATLQRYVLLPLTFVCQG